MESRCRCVLLEDWIHVLLRFDFSQFMDHQDRRADWLLKPVPSLVYLLAALVGVWLAYDTMIHFSGVAGDLLMFASLFAIPIVSALAIARPARKFFTALRLGCISYPPFSITFSSAAPFLLIHPPPLIPYST